MSNADLIKKAREGAGLSQHDLAAKTGLSQSSLSRIESGAREAQTPELALIAEATGRVISELTGRRSRTHEVKYAARSSNGADMQTMKDALDELVSLDLYLQNYAF
ncbi:helix-turn-helix domain-containing protein [Nesterenkonia populi]